MAVLSLASVWVNLIASGEAVASQSTEPSRKAEVDGEVRTYGDGRQRSITRPGIKGSFAFTLRMITLVEVETLESWQGQPVQVRDHLGQRFFGVFYAVNTTPRKIVDMYDAQIELRTITMVEGV